MAMASKTSPWPTSCAGNVSILLGDGAGSFSAATNFTVGNGPTSVAVGDFNGDGKQDLAVANIASSERVDLVGQWHGQFQRRHKLRRWHSSSLSSGGRFQWRWQARPGRGQLRLKQRLDLVRGVPGNRESNHSRGDDLQPFSSGTAEIFGSVKYRVNEELIDRVAPGGFRYWVSVTAAAGNNTFKVTQTITTGNFSTFFTANKNAIRVFDSDCVSLERTAKQNGDTVTVRFNAPSAGTYYIGVTFDADSLLGAPAPNPETVHYDFATTGVPDSTSGLDLVKH